MATGDFFSRYKPSNYLKHLSEEREKNKKKEEESYNIQLGGTLETLDNVTYSTTSNTALYTGSGSSVTISGSNTFIGYNSITPTYGYYNTAIGYTTIPASPLYGTISYSNGLTSGSYNVTFDIPMIFENDIIKIKDGKVYINDKLEMNPTRIGLALLKALDSKNKESLNDPKEMFNKD